MVSLGTIPNDTGRNVSVERAQSMTLVVQSQNVFKADD
jgi:hypothetical protein